jgi:hypothetical protein
MTAHSDFSATDSALGYLYQIRWALLSAIQRLTKAEVFATYFEKLDDVTFQPNDSVPELAQLKHHNLRAANLTNASPDIWKSFRVWIEGRGDGSIPEDSQLCLITTSSVGLGSSASYLMVEARDEAEALRQLRLTATTSTTRKNKIAYSLFKNLSPEAQARLISSIVIFPDTPNISAVTDALRDEVRLTVRRNHLDSFIQRLEGWWFKRAIEQLADPHIPPILSNELESEIYELSEQFKPDSLPVDSDILDTEVNADAYQDAVFVQQVKLAGIGSNRIFAAIRDYYRAFEQRSRWVREDLLLVGELGRYEKRLKEAWELEFNRIIDDMGASAAEEAKQAAAKQVYAWVERSCFPIRTQVQHESMSRGSFHILSDNLKVGWHPDFMQHLKQLLEP